MKNEIFTKKQLIDLWLAKYPDDLNHPDLEQQALAGYVKLKNGLYIWYGLYKLMKNIQY